MINQLVVYDPIDFERIFIWYGGFMLLKQILTLIFVTIMMITTASAAEEGDTRIVGTNHHNLFDINVKSGDEISIIAELEEYGPKSVFGIYDHDTPRDWVSCTLRDLDMGVSDSHGNVVHTDQTRTRFITDEAHFNGFSLRVPGKYTCYIKYEGNLKHCQTQFQINVT